MFTEDIGPNKMTSPANMFQSIGPTGYISWPFSRMSWYIFTTVEGTPKLLVLKRFWMVLKWGKWMKMRWVQAKAWRHVFAFHNFEAPASCINCHPTMFCHVLPVAAACRSGLRTLRYSAEGACSLCRCLLGASHISWEHQHGPEWLYFKHQRPHCNLNFLTLQNLLPGISMNFCVWALLEFDFVVRNLILLFGLQFVNHFTFALRYARRSLPADYA